MHPLPIHVSAKFHLDIFHSKQDMVIGIFHIWSNNFLAYQRFSTNISLLLHHHIRTHANIMTLDAVDTEYVTTVRCPH